MKRKPAMYSISAAVLATLWPFVPQTMQAKAPQVTTPTFKSVWDGVYTADQAVRGKEFIHVYCSECHGETGGGGRSPAITGAKLMERWHGGPLDNVYDYMSTKMPPERPRGDLTDESYLDILAMMLHETGVPAGTKDLTRDSLWTIYLVGKEGAQPLASQSPVLTVGCVTQNPDNTWALTRAIEPVRNKKLDETNPNELNAYGSMPLGELTFRLNNAASYRPDLHKGHKVLVKGVLGRLAAGNRINVTFLEKVAETCGPELNRGQ